MAKKSKKKQSSKKKPRKSTSKQSDIENICIVFRKDSPDARKLAKELSAWLLKKKLNIFTHPGQKITGIKPLGKNKAARADLDLVIVLGGDGTYLEAVRFLNGEKVPILGVNLGSLGFLTEIRVENLYKSLQICLDGKMEKRPRAMIQLKIVRGKKVVSSHLALNDVVIERGDNSHLIHMGIYREGQLVSELKADGLIVATPTGSTAYNLAAGGPILQPNVGAMVVTPVCPHSLTNRPIIFHDDQLLVFKLIADKPKARLTVDGQDRGQVSSHDEILVQKAPCTHYVLRQKSHNYFDLLREKLKFGERA